MKEIRLGIVGSGFMGRTIAETVTHYLPDAQLVAVTGGSRGPGLARDYGVDYEPAVGNLVARRDIDAVFIHSPHSEHAVQAIEAARQGKHIFLDKPMATSVADCDRIIDAARLASVNLMIAFGQRFRICNIVARQLILDGKIGRVKMIQERMLNSGGLVSLPPWQSRPENLGVLFGHAVHNIDRIRWLTGEEIISVAARVERDAKSGNEVSTMALFGLSGGVMASVWESWDIPEPGIPRSGCSAWIAGETGILDLDAYGLLRLGRDGAWSAMAEQAPIDWKGKGMLDPARIDSYRLQVEEFLNSIREGRSPSVTGADGRAAVEVALAAYQSAAENRTVELRRQEAAV
ncbi:MAG: Gfo/Idh/MocA family protein [Candidatus Acidiferrales bacterium]